MCRTWTILGPMVRPRFQCIFLYFEHSYSITLSHHSNNALNWRFFCVYVAYWQLWIVHTIDAFVCMCVRMKSGPSNTHELYCPTPLGSYFIIRSASPLGQHSIEPVSLQPILSLEQSIVFGSRTSTTTTHFDSTIIVIIQTFCECLRLRLPTHNDRDCIRSFDV